MNDTKQRILDVSLELFSQMVFLRYLSEIFAGRYKSRKALYIITSKVSRLFLTNYFAYSRTKQAI